MNKKTSILVDFDRNLFAALRLPQLYAAAVANRLFIGFLAVVALLSYSADLFNFALGMDSENHAYDYGAKTGWVNQGRWGMYLLSRMLLPDAVMPFTPTFIAIAGLATGAYFLMLTFSSKRGPADYLAAPIAIGSPVIYFALYFTTLGYGVGIAVAVTSIGLYLLTRWTVAGFVAAILAFAFGIGVYQAMLPLVLVMFAFYFMLTVLDENPLPFGDACKRIAIFAVALALAFIVYKLLVAASLKVMDLSYDEGYLSNFMRFTPTREYFEEAWPRTLQAAIDYYTGGKDLYLYDLVSLRCLFALTLAVSVYRLLSSSHQSSSTRLLGMLALPAAIAAPMAMHFLNMGYMPPRTVLGVPWVIAGMVFVAASARSNLLRLAVGVLVVATFYNFTVANNRYAFANYMKWQADRELSVLMLERMGKVWHKLPHKSIHDRYPIELVGVREYFETPILVKREVIGSSFYNWAAGDVTRMVKLFWSMGVFDYREPTVGEKLSVADAALTMPSWPYEGAVDVVNGVIVVKLDEYNPNQIVVMCNQRPEHDFCKRNMPKSW